MCFKTSGKSYSQHLYGYEMLLIIRLSGYQSFLRPKGIPQINWFVLFALRMLWLLGGIWNAYPKVKMLFYKTGLTSWVERFHLKIMVSFSCRMIKAHDSTV